MMRNWRCGSTSPTAREAAISALTPWPALARQQRLPKKPHFALNVVAAGGTNSESRILTFPRSAQECIHDNSPV
jgi:hypothetical protein